MSDEAQGENQVPQVSRVALPYTQEQLEERRRLRRRKIRRRRWVAGAAALLVVLFAVPAYSYVSTMLEPSSLPWSIRSIEWLRDHHGAGLVNTVERVWYTWTAPKKGGPGLTALPAVDGSLLPSASPTKAHSHVKPPYRPPDVTPAITPALPHEGVWSSTGVWSQGGPTILVTVFRNERDYPRIVTYVAWIDTRRTQLALYPGRYQPPFGGPRGPMSIPDGQRWRALASFNSGFTYKNAQYGFATHGHAYLPLHRGQATVVAYRNGRVDIIAWNGGSSPPPDVVLARQNLRLIVVGGKPGPALSLNQADWGWTLGNAVRVWRSGLGIDAHGNLIYAAAPEQTVISLAKALVRAGAVRAMEFDINTAWPTFNFYRKPGLKQPVKFIPNRQNPGLTRYFYPDDRDFFVVYQRSGSGNPGVPFR